MKKVLLGLGLILASTGIAIAADNQSTTNSMTKTTTTTAMPTTNKSLAAQNIVVKAPEIQLMQNSSNSADAFMQLNNKGNHTATLIAANSMTADQTLLQKANERDGKQTTTKISKITIKPNSSTTLQQNGIQVSLMGLKQTLHKGDSVPILLIFDDGSSMTVKATVG